MFKQPVELNAAAAIGLILTVLALGRAMPAQAEQPNSAMPAARMLEVFGRLPMISNLTLSPDGSKIAQVANLPEGLFLVITDTATHKGLNRVPLPASKIRGLLWADNQKLIVVHSTASMVWGLENGREEWALGYMIDFGSGKATRFLEKVETSVERLEPMNTLARPPVVVTGPKGEPQVILTGLIFPESVSHLALFRQNAVRASLFVSGSEDTAG